MPTILVYEFAFIFSKQTRRASCKASLCTMNKIRKFFRGSGRVLAFIFVASVIWLLFDMAALRLSFSEISTGILKEDIRRREQTGFKVQPDRMKILHSSITGMRLPQNQVWSKENFRKVKAHTLKEKESMDQVQRRGKLQVSLERGKAVPLWHPAHLQTFPGSLTMQKTEGRDSKPEASSQYMTPKPTTVLSQRTPFTALRGTPRTKISVHTETFAENQEAPKNHTLSRNASKSASEGTLNRAIIVRIDPSKHQSQTGTKSKAHFVSPPILEYGEAIAIKKTESQSKGLKHKPHKVLPLFKFVADTGHLKRQSVNETESRGLPEDGRAKVAPGKKLNFSESQIVIITKEDDLGTDTKEVPDSKTQTVIPKLLGASQGKHIPGNQSKTYSTPLGPQRAVSQAKLALARGLYPARSNLTAKAQTAGHQQSHTNTPENHGRHRVLRIDESLSPRDPNAPDEVWSALLRSVHSILNRSPPHLIKEILLVDDFSTKGKKTDLGYSCEDYLKDNLDKYMSQFPKVRILRLKERHGLIRARLAGAQNATGDVLTFLDSHVECNVGWLEPLLERVYLNRKKVACPVIEVINDKDMSYMTVDNFQRGVFTWPMNFGWRTIPPDVVAKSGIKETDIIRCPVMAGGLFSIDKSYFYELGTYDPGLDVWGGENMELSFKVWMCGGEIEIIPCSRVGHIFRNDNPYSFPKDRMKTVERNLVRVAEVWLDEYKELFYGHGDHLIDQGLDVGNLTQQRELRKRLKCKSFKWYLENVFPDLKAPVVRASGVLVNVALGKCVSIENTTATLEDCDGSSQDPLPTTLAAERVAAMRGQQRDGMEAVSGMQELLEIVKGLSSQEIITKSTEEEILKEIYKGVQKLNLKFRYK
ncbi:polypeptide N-acetylgalactosaminyltransferase 5 [Cricetulus griseus]